MVPRDGQLTYLVSEVLVDELTWTSRDRGYDPITNTQVWGSEHGQLCFDRITSYSDQIEYDWFT